MPVNLRRVCKKLGIQVAGPDHPIYREAPYTVFINRRESNKTEENTAEPAKHTKDREGEADAK